MPILLLDSVKSVERQYLTGEEPVLVMCSDKNAYICKYMRSSFAAYKLACELIGAQMSMAWHLNTPEIAFVRIRPSHWSNSLEAMLKPMNAYYLACINRSRQLSSHMLQTMPKDWNVPFDVVERKIGQLFDSKWIDCVWHNFTECLTENIGK